MLQCSPVCTRRMSHDTPDNTHHNARTPWKRSILGRVRGSTAFRSFVLWWWGNRQSEMLLLSPDAVYGAKGVVQQRWAGAILLMPFFFWRGNGMMTDQFLRCHPAGPENDRPSRHVAIASVLQPISQL